MREALNYSQGGWAVVLGVRERTIRRWETGETLVPNMVLQTLYWRLNHGSPEEGPRWRQLISHRPQVEEMLRQVGLLDVR